MGGASEHDEAMKWFLNKANGGDILVLRTSGSDGYNDYMYSQLGVSTNSVETIVCHNALASNESYVQDRIKEAEGIWFAGGDQWTYIDYWRDTPIDSLINEGIQDRNMVIGGTSAGMAIQGQYYFSAENGTITSAEALANPFDNTLTVSGDAFIQNDILSEVITDTHYDNPDRKGRHVSFLARMLNDYAANAKGIACDEYTAVCIEPNGIAKVYGDPSYEDIAYFLQVNCEVQNNSPETIQTNTPLTWNQNNDAIRVYKIQGDNSGTGTFNLNNWQNGTGGTWERWYIQDGVLFETASQATNCSLSLENLAPEFSIYPNPASEIVFISSKLKDGVLSLKSLDGRTLLEQTQSSFSVESLENGTYILEYEGSIINLIVHH